MHLSVIIPAYNEEKRIGKTLEAVSAYLKKQSFSWEIVVVNNNSKDRTVDLIQEYQAHIPHLKLLHESQPGKGYAVAKGMLGASGDFRLFTDADNSTSIDHIERMMPYFQKGYDVVIGSLTEPGSKIVSGGEEPIWRGILGEVGNKWIQGFAGWGVSETQRGFKMLTAKAVKEIFPRLTVFGWGFDVEVLAIAKLKGYKIKEVPVTWDNDPDSKVNIWAYPQVLLQTIQIFWNKITGRYV